MMLKLNNQHQQTGNQNLCKKNVPSNINTFISFSHEEDEDIFKTLIKNQSEGLSDFYKRIEDTITTTTLRKEYEFRKI